MSSPTDSPSYFRRASTHVAAKMPDLGVKRALSNASSKVPLLRRAPSRADTALSSDAPKPEPGPGPFSALGRRISNQWAASNARSKAYKVRKAAIRDELQRQKQERGERRHRARLRQQAAQQRAIIEQHRQSRVHDPPHQQLPPEHRADREPSIERGRPTLRTASGSIRSIRPLRAAGVRTSTSTTRSALRQPSCASDRSYASSLRICRGCGQHRQPETREIIAYITKHVSGAVSNNHAYSAGGSKMYNETVLVPIFAPVGQISGGGTPVSGRSRSSSVRQAVSPEDSRPITGLIRRSSAGDTPPAHPLSCSTSASPAASPDDSTPARTARATSPQQSTLTVRVPSPDLARSPDGSVATIDPQPVHSRKKEHKARHNPRQLAQWRSGRADQATATPQPQRAGAGATRRSPTVRREGSPHTIAEPEWASADWTAETEGGSVFSWGGDGVHEYGTPETSPEGSPGKEGRPGVWRFPRLVGGLGQMDGSSADSGDDLDEGQNVAVGEEEETPLVPASPAKGAKAFPFPAQVRSGSPQRRPSALMRHCERNATPRQQRLMTGGWRSPDRFVPSRAGTPTKEGLVLAKPVEKRGALGKQSRRQAAVPDPFAPAPRRSFRVAEQLATLRAPAPLPRAVGRASTLVTAVTDGERRGVSEGAVWTVGGALVTEGVASTTNGRGGRVTSGTSAPHYAADFLRKASASEEERTHGRRLALAMEIDQGARMLDHSSPVSMSSPGSSGSPAASPSTASDCARTWRDCAWETEGPASPTKRKPKQAKDIPIIPFRVLDAPALRDDYYCSLLAYSPTLHCLAVGLGPHVYLWSENKTATTNRHLPDSLTAPFAAHVTSLSFSSAEGGSAILAIGRADGRLTLWSPFDTDPRFDSEQPAPVSCVSFRPKTFRRPSVREPGVMAQTEELLVGDEAGNVYFYAVEWPAEAQRDLWAWGGSLVLVARLGCHGQQVCGLAWSGDGEVFATGANDNQVFLFERRKILRTPPPASSAGARGTGRMRGDSDATVNVRSGESDSNTPDSNAATVPGQPPVLTITAGQHKHLFHLNAAIKALAFAPWQPTLLAAGGGSNDRCIHFFHTRSGAKLATIDCFAQVTSLVWNEKRRELAATFGFAQPEHRVRIAVFGWPGCECRVKVPWVSEERALWGVGYPGGPRGMGSGGGDGEGARGREEGCLVVATSDASIKFHEVWADAPVRGDGDGWGMLGGSQILAGVLEMERTDGIR